MAREPIVLNDADGDDVCDSDEVLGCQNCAVPAITIQVRPTLARAHLQSGCDECAGNPTSGSGFVQDNDADDDGVCDVDEVLGLHQFLRPATIWIAATEDSGSVRFAC